MLITTGEELRNIIGYSSELVANKVIRNLDQLCLDFISPYIDWLLPVLLEVMQMFL